MSTYADRVSSRWGKEGKKVARSFWNSEVVTQEINRRLTGDPELTALESFRRRHCARPRRLALSLGSGEGQFEIEAVRSGVCERIIGIDISAERVARAQARVPDELRDRVMFVVE